MAAAGVVETAGVETAAGVVGVAGVGIPLMAVSEMEAVRATAAVEIDTTHCRYQMPAERGLERAVEAAEMAGVAME